MVSLCDTLRSQKSSAWRRFDIHLNQFQANAKSGYQDIMRLYVNIVASQANSLHVVIDGNVITGQNEASTLTAVQNLVLLATQTR